MVKALVLLKKYFETLNKEKSGPKDKPKYEHVVQLLDAKFRKQFPGDITWGLTRPPPDVVPPSAGGGPHAPSATGKEYRNSPE